MTKSKGFTIAVDAIAARVASTVLSPTPRLFVRMVFK
eukprot:CAMPEP_0176473226 /NCGR_PEP_ID=MMETSP0127-20121128/42180_1 /TAXON_ID=938130 /ORGANISM="Platyophrya macrostoma, Strain WH" /LENGTH=36 /DNA_ID= /DNA_START= /DNA_END= /DNA_ORIENTATION=